MKIVKMNNFKRNSKERIKCFDMSEHKMKSCNENRKPISFPST